MCVVQVARATLWSCFPVSASASGADMLLFSLLHTSSGCCIAETNHGLLRLPPPPSCRFHFFKALSLFLPVFFLRLPPFSHSIAFGRGSSRPSAWASRISLKTALLGWEERTGDLFLSSTPTPCSLCLCSWFDSTWKRCSLSSPPTLNLYLLYLSNCFCLVLAFRESWGVSLFISSKASLWLKDEKKHYW